MEKRVIEATRRTVTGKQVGQLRRQGKLPAVLYGTKLEATPILLDRRAASKTLQGLSASSLVTIDLDGSEHNALVREIQRDYLRNELIHVDFMVVSMTEKIKASVPVYTTGDAHAVREFNGVVITGLSTLEVEALPQDLPDRFTVDVSELDNIGDAIYVRDLTLPTGVNVLTSMDEMLVVINPGAAEEEEVVEEEAEVEEPEVIERGKHDEEEAEEE